MTTIVLVEDHQIVRQGLQVLLNATPDFQLVGEASDGPEALQRVEETRPDVLVLDLMLPGLSGLEVARQAPKRSPGTRVVVLSMQSSEVYVAEAFRAGAMAYVLKSASWAELVYAIREAMAGRRFLSPQLSESAVSRYERALPAETAGPANPLTSRERQIAQLVTEGLTSAGIAARLGISPRTVEMHRHNLMQKLSLRTQADLIRYAIQSGMVMID